MQWQAPAYGQHNRPQARYSCVRVAGRPGHRCLITVSVLSGDPHCGAWPLSSEPMVRLKVPCPGAPPHLTTHSSSPPYGRALLLSGPGRVSFRTVWR
jgi:hypothetical protein